MTYPDATVRTYHYNEAAHTAGANLPYALTGITDENGTRYATFKYDTSGRAVSTEYAGGVGKVTLSYASGSTTATDALNTSRTYTFETSLGVARNTGISQPCSASGCGGGTAAATTYDANGNASSRKDFNDVLTCYGFELSRNLPTIRAEGLTSASCPSDLSTWTPASGTLERKLTTEWNSTWRLPLRIAEPNRITTFQYDSSASLISKSIQATTDANGSLGLSATPTGSPRTWTYTHTYHASLPGFITETLVNGPRTDVGDTTTYSYDTTSGSIASVTNPLGHVTSFGNFDAHGRARQITDPNGLVTDLTYDLRGRLTSRALGGETTGYEYDALGQLTKVTLPDSAYLSYTYDDAHRLTQLQDSLGNRIVYTLDLIGNRTKDEVFDPAASLVHKREREYDSLSRLIKDIGGTNPATQITQYGYDNQGNLTTIDGPLPGTLDVTINLYDALNRLRQVTDPGQGITQYGLNALDQLTSVTDPRNNVTTYSLDGLNNLNSQTSPDTGATVNTFDDAGNLLTSRDAKNQTTTYQYDALNRVTRVTYHDGSQVQYGYDQAVYGIGRLTSISEAAPGGAMTIQALYAYDLHGRLASETRFIGAQAFVTQYGYDSAGRLNLLTYPSGRQVAYRFDALGRIVGIITTPLGGTTQSVISGVSYQPFGGVTGFTYGNGQHYTRNIDLDGRIAGYSLGTAGYSVGFDAASRIRSIINSGNAADARSFDYDVLDRLTSTTTPSTAFGFNYDANGNRTLHSVGLASWTYTYPSTSNRLANILGGGSRTYLEDANGSVTSDGVNGFTYDARGRLTQASTALGSANYQLNALGQRYAKTLQGATTWFHYDSQGHLIAETGATGNTLAEYLYLGELPVAVWR